MTQRASSSRPGFSYLVGVTDSPLSRLKNFNETASCGGEGMMGRPRRAGEDGCVDGRGEAATGGGGGGAREGGGIEGLACGAGDWEPAREREVSWS